METGLFAQQYTNWKHLLPTECKWGDFKPFWTKELDLWHKTAHTAAQTGYASNVTNNTEKEEYECAEHAYYASFQNFGEANKIMQPHAAI